MILVGALVSWSVHAWAGGGSSWAERGTMHVLVDDSGTLDIAAVAEPERAGDFRAVAAQSINLGFTDAVLWARLTLDLPAGEAWNLQVDYPLLDELSLFTRDGPERWRREDAGDRQPFEKRTLKHRVPVFALPPGGGEPTVVYLRVRTRGSMQLPVSLWSAPGYFAHAAEESMIFGVYYGMMLVMVLYNLFLFASVRDRNYLLYVGFIGSFALLQLIFNGLAIQYLWSGTGWWAHRAPVIMPSIVAMFGLAFSRSILDLKRVAPRLDRMMGWMLWFILLELVIAVVGDYKLAAQMVALLAVAFALMLMPAAVISMLRGYRPARYFLVAWTAFLGGVLLTGLLLYGLVPHNALTAYSMQVGSGLEVFLLSLALADRINLLRAEKERAQEQMVQMERRGKHELARVVDERTMELRQAKEHAERVAVELEEKNVLLSEQAAHDSLTGLLNRRVFMEQLERAVQANLRSGRPVALVLFDLDHFKHINDTFGHPVGDQVLRAVGNVLRTSQRGSDASGRYGGEEFAMLVDGVGIEQATLSAERIRKCIEAITIPGFPELSASASFGVCAADRRLQDFTVNALVRSADRALYDAKASGRNRVCVRLYDATPTLVDATPVGVRAASPV